MHALITGATGAIGEALATELDAHGYTLTLVARRTEKLAALADRCRDAHPVTADLASLDRLPALIDAAVARSGPIDLLINNAGVQFVEAIEGVRPARLQQLVTLNLTAPMTLAAAVLPSMKERGAGALVNITSMAGVSPVPGMAHYAGSKAGLAAWSEAAHAELAHHDIHVLTVYPGSIRSEMHEASVKRLRPGPGTWLSPVGDPAVLAQQIVHALQHRRERIVYPRTYALGFHLPRSLTQAAVRLLTPALETP